jgi:hypothetical protein
MKQTPQLLSAARLSVAPMMDFTDRTKNAA